MTGSLTTMFNMRTHLEMYWLRPESALWDAIAATHIGRLLKGKKDILEIGIGNGYFTFLMLGGLFKPAFDWFHNVKTEGFLDNADIFDHDSGVVMEPFIERKPDTRIRVALDHKQSLLNQVNRLGFVDKLLQHNCNQPLPISGFSTVYSNMLYWLDNPFQVIDNIRSVLHPGGEMIAVFPNSDFYRSCVSYEKKTALWANINRGRASHIMWHMDREEFESEINRRGGMRITHFQRYLAPTTLKIWDIGLRPISVPLIKMANSLFPESRVEIKAEWCETLLRFAEPLLEEELEHGEKSGGYNLVRLVKDY